MKSISRSLKIKELEEEIDVLAQQMDVLEKQWQQKNNELLSLLRVAEFDINK